MTFTKNFRSPSAEEWFVFLPDFQDPLTGGAAGKAIIHYDLELVNRLVGYAATLFSMHAGENSYDAKYN
nr:hypothetical protein [Rossellomorea vietnamensis]